jgi:hypothetical protein
MPLQDIDIKAIKNDLTALKGKLDELGRHL